MGLLTYRPFPRYVPTLKASAWLTKQTMGMRKLGKSRSARGLDLCAGWISGKDEDRRSVFAKHFPRRAPEWREGLVRRVVDLYKFSNVATFSNLRKVRASLCQSSRFVALGETLPVGPSAPFSNYSTFQQLHFIMPGPRGGYEQPNYPITW